MDILNKPNSMKSIKIRLIRVINSKSPPARKEGMWLGAKLTTLIQAKLTLLTKVQGDHCPPIYSSARKNVRSSKRSTQTGIHTKSWKLWASFGKKCQLMRRETSKSNPKKIVKDMRQRDMISLSARTKSRKSSTLCLKLSRTGQESSNNYNRTRENNLRIIFITRNT